MVAKSIRLTYGLVAIAAITATATDVADTNDIVATIVIGALIVGVSTITATALSSVTVITDTNADSFVLVGFLLVVVIGRNLSVDLVHTGV